MISKLNIFEKFLAYWFTYYKKTNSEIFAIINGRISLCILGMFYLGIIYFILGKIFHFSVTIGNIYTAFLTVVIPLYTIIFLVTKQFVKKINYIIESDIYLGKKMYWIYFTIGIALMVGLLVIFGGLNT